MKSDHEPMNKYTRLSNSKKKMGRSIQFPQQKSFYSLIILNVSQHIETDEQQSSVLLTTTTITETYLLHTAILHSKYTKLCIFGGTVLGSRDAQPDNLSCVGWVDDSIVPQPSCGIIRTSFSLVCVDYLCLESFLLFFLPLPKQRLQKLELGDLRKEYSCSSD